MLYYIMDEDLKEIPHCQDDEDDEKCYVNKIENYYQLVFTSTLYPNKNKNTHYCHNKINELPGIIVFKMAANNDDSIVEYTTTMVSSQDNLFCEILSKVVGHHLATILKNIRDRERDIEIDSETDIDIQRDRQ